MWRTRSRCAESSSALTASMDWRFCTLYRQRLGFARSELKQELCSLSSVEFERSHRSIRFKDSFWLNATKSRNERHRLWAFVCCYHSNRCRRDGQITRMAACKRRGNAREVV